MGVAGGSGDPSNSRVSTSSVTVLSLLEVWDQKKVGASRETGKGRCGMGVKGALPSASPQSLDTPGTASGPCGHITVTPAEE
jgi:hypothetical protein